MYHFIEVQSYVIFILENIFASELVKVFNITETLFHADFDIKLNTQVSDIYSIYIESVLDVDILVELVNQNLIFWDLELLLCKKATLFSISNKLNVFNFIYLLFTNVDIYAVLSSLAVQLLKKLEHQKNVFHGSILDS